MNPDLEYGREVLRVEAQAVEGLVQRLDQRFVTAVERILNCEGRVVVTGMGKPGIIGKKISATMASTGTPSIALHPAEALHGDLGRVLPEDVSLVLSNSGTTEEIVRLIPHLKKIGTYIIAITGNPESTLGEHADLVMDIGPITEACPMGLAPSASTTAMIALGDALALAVLNRRDFGVKDYGAFHPGGSLGRQLLRVSEIMRKGSRNPIIRMGKPVREALFAITEARAGAISIVDEEGQLAGIFTDGDLRRHLAADDSDLSRDTIESVMTRAPLTIRSDRLASEAIRILRERKIDELPVVNEKGEPVGMLDVQDLLDAGLV